MMNKRERVLRALNRESVDRPPVLCVNSTATSPVAGRLHLKWPLFHQKAEEMARMALGALEIFDFDAVRLPFCQTIEAEALGCEVSYKDFFPGNDVALYPLDATPEFPEDFLNRGRIPEVLKAVELLRRDVGRRAFVLGGVVGPLTIARALLDSAPLLKASLKAPQKIVPFLEVAQKACLQMSLAMQGAGVDAIVIEDMTASPDLLHPKTYKDTVSGYHRQLIRDITAPVILHVCGNVTLIAGEMAGTGVHALSIDPKAETELVREKIGQEVILIGGVDTILLSLSSPREIKEVSLKALKAGINILGPGCSIPPNAPTENLKAMVQAAEEFTALA
jgi:[methyl-Co(III) methanol-specific corrinoid protein]:coenzyme M methyltransferase